MPNEPLQILAVIGSLHRNAVTRIVVQDVIARLQAAGCGVDLLDFSQEPLALYNPETSYEAPGYKPLKARVLRAGVFLLATPDYHGCMSGATKNFLDHFWQEFTGKLFASIVASNEKGLTVHDQIRTAARQCYAWSLPYGVSFSEREDIKDGKVASLTLASRLEMLARDLHVYGELLARQRCVEMAATDTSFMAKVRK